MTAKKRDKEVTPDQMREKYKNELAGFWLNSEVLFGPNFFPIAPTFTESVTILFLLDAGDFTTERMIEALHTWTTKYTKLPWIPVLVFQQKYAFMKNQKFLDRYKNQKIFIDVFGELFDRYGSSQEPVAVLLKNGQLTTSTPLLPDLSGNLFQIENELQKLLRVDDPGLPLPVAEKWSKKGAPMEQKFIKPTEVTTSGEWNGSDAMLFTESNNATISIPFKGKHLRMVAMAHPNSLESVKASVTFNDKSLYNGIQGPMIHDDNSGNSMIDINKAIGNYDLIQSDHEITGIIKITFLNVYDIGVIFYGFKTS
jgi:hypothetical protein